MSATSSVRRLAKDDLTALLALYQHLHPDDTKASSIDSLQVLWNQLLADPCRIFVGAFVDGNLASTANVAIIGNFTRGGRPYAVIENVITHPDHRREGLGRMVLTEILQACNTHNCYKVMLMSGAERESAHAFYSAIGFDGDAKRAFVMRL